jgi:hypothetical protein
MKYIEVSVLDVGMIGILRAKNEKSVIPGTLECHGDEVSRSVATLRDNLI